MTSVRDCIVCSPTRYTNETQPKGTIRVMCGVCRCDVWLSERHKERFFSKQEQYIVACLPCGFQMYLDIIDQRPDVALNIRDVIHYVELKRRKPGKNDTFVLPTWMVNGLEFDITSVSKEEPGHE